MEPAIALALLPFVEATDLTKQQGQGDRRLQAYCFRICMTNDPALRIDWPKPDGYDAAQYELALRWSVAEKDDFNELAMPPGKGATHQLRKMDLLTQPTAGGFRKTDTNNHGAVSSDFIGGNWKWPEATYAERERMFQEHVRWQQGYYWTMANNPRVPDRYRDAYRTWGLARDEFKTTGGWSHTLYVREGRRLVSDYVLTERDCTHQIKCPDPVGMGSYVLDSHNTTRFVTTGRDGKPTVMNEGDVQRPPAGPYGISYRSIVPHAVECANLLVPVCCATSHIAFGSVRMEPVFMVLGESAAHAAALAIRGAKPVQAVSYEALKSALLDAKQVLTL
ncbi:MAG: FAD-dependent oxidoreductase [Proteobacteria bacterium]|nr:MAG: FAD-dependent oxidoreductase [Pseudomonadota bacterium]